MKHPKKLFASALLAFSLMIGFGSVAMADSNYWHFPWNDGDDIPSEMHLYADDIEYQFVVKNPTTRQAEFWAFDGSIVWDTQNKRAEIGNISQDNIDLLVPTLAGKASVSSVNSLSSSLNALTTSFNNSAADWNATGTSTARILNKPQVWHNGSLQTNSKRITFTGSTSNGGAVFYLTNDGTVNGSALCASAPRYVDIQVNDVLSMYSTGYAITNSNKTLTVSANVLNLGSLVSAANGKSIEVAVDCN